MCRYARFDFKKLGNKDFLNTSPIIPEIPEASVSQYTLNTTSQLPFTRPDDDDAAAADPRMSSELTVDDYPLPTPGGKRRTPQTLTGTQGIQDLLKDRGSKMSDEEVIELYEEEDKETTRSRPSQSQQRRRMTTTTNTGTRSPSVTSMAPPRRSYFHEDIGLLQSSSGAQASVKSSKNGKMECSIINFISNYPKWTPMDEDTDRFIIDSVNRSQLKEHK